jgi:hypothetical protein
MKIIYNFGRELPSMSYCKYCDDVDYIVTLKNGECSNCPICKCNINDHADEYYAMIEERIKRNYHIRASIANFYLCPECLVLFEIDLHGNVNGDNIYVARFINGFQMSEVKYPGMPKFKNMREYLFYLDQITVLGTVSSDDRNLYNKFCYFDPYLSKLPVAKTKYTMNKYNFDK